MTTFAAWPSGYAQAHGSPNAQTIKTFSNSTNVTKSDTGTAATHTYDAASPFGATRLRVDCPAGNTNTEVQIHTGLSVAKWPDGETIAFRLWFDDWQKVADVQLYAGTASYTRYLQRNLTVQSSNVNNRNGPITFDLNSHITSVNTFTYGSDTLASVKIRVVPKSGEACRFWVDSFSIAPKSRPCVIITFDDASDTWVDTAAPYLLTNNMLATFGVGTEQIGTNDSTYCTAAELLTLQVAGHDVQVHNVTNTSFASSGLKAYMAEYDAAAAQLRTWGITNPFIYHPFVQGLYDQTALDALARRGVKVMRGVDSASATTCRINQPSAGTYTDNIVNLKIGNHGASLSLAQATTNITNLLKYGGTYVAMFHDIVPSGATGVETNEADFTGFIDLLARHRAAGLLDVMKVSDWYQGLTQPQVVS
jgi:peptidoglycan/xylan/chitin deacetylase (PgdA/CDA1 family)